MIVGGQLIKVKLVLLSMILSCRWTADQSKVGPVGRDSKRIEDLLFPRTYQGLLLIRVRFMNYKMGLGVVKLSVSQHFRPSFFS